MNNLNLHKRRSIRLKEYDYSLPGEYFVTINVYDKQCLFGNFEDVDMKLSPQGKIAQQCWLDIPKHFKNVELDEYVIMPNHIHGILVLCESTVVGVEYIQPLQEDIQLLRELQKTYQHIVPNSIPSIIRSFKAAVTRECKKTGFNFGWQRNYYEHVIRSEKDLQNVRDYITSNPLGWKKDKENPYVTTQ
jgi:REP element-mobilizing transposase RayT